MGKDVKTGRTKMTTGYIMNCIMFINIIQMWFYCVLLFQVVVNVIAEMVGSWRLALIFQTSHVISEVRDDVTIAFNVHL